MIKVEGHSDLRRDESTGAIINVNNSAYNNYLFRQRNRDAQDNELETMKEDLDSLKSDINDIKNLLSQLVQK